MYAACVGRLSWNHSARAVKSVSLAAKAGCRVVTARSGTTPTRERALTGTECPSGNLITS